MAILTHGSDLMLAATVTPIVAQTDGTLRTALDRLSQLKFGAVQLDATLAGVRPRDLNSRARRDLVSLIARRGMRLAGVDLFLPRKHYLDAGHLDRAMAATLAGIELAADLGRVPVTVAVPIAQLPGDARAAIAEAADGRGVTVAVQGEGQWQELAAWLDEVDLPLLGMALDPTAALAQKQDPAALAHEHAKRLRIARLSDYADGQAGRCAIGQGELDVTAYRIAVDLAPSRVGPVVLDLRGLPNALAAASNAQRAWDDASFAV